MSFTQTGHETMRGDNCSPKRVVAGLAVAAMLTLGVGGCGKPYTYKYKITVSVRDRGKLKSAASVVSVREMVAPGGALMQSRVCGEATAVPLHDGKYLFALLNGLPYPPPRYAWRDTPTAVLLSRLGLPVQFGGPGEDDSGILRLTHATDAITITGDELPEFMTFGDLNDPKTARRVDPENPQVTLGGGVTFEKITVQATEEEITRGKIRSLLPWINPSNDFLDGSFAGRAVGRYQTDQFENCSGFWKD